MHGTLSHLIYFLNSFYFLSTSKELEEMERKLDEATLAQE